MTKRGRHIVAAPFVFVVMTALAILFGLGPVVSSAADGEKASLEWEAR